MFVSLRLREGPLEKLWGGEEGGEQSTKFMQREIE